jgi:hypothetical protein
LREFDAPNMPDLKKISAPMCQLSAGAKKLAETLLSREVK